MTKPIEEYTNEELDRLCAEAMGVELKTEWEEICEDSRTILSGTIEYTPTTNKEQAMELLERFKLDVEWDGTQWVCHYFVNSYTNVVAPTPALAICRAVAAMYLEKRND